MSFFSRVELVPGDPILGLTEAYNADTRPGKVNLGVGIYYDEQGRIPLLNTVRKVEQSLAAEAKPRGYVPIDGLPAYTLATQKLLFGAQSPLLEAGRVATSQTVGGSGALRIHFLAVQSEFHDFKGLLGSRSDVLYMYSQLYD